VTTQSHLALQDVEKSLMAKVLAAACTDLPSLDLTAILREKPWQRRWQPKYKERTEAGGFQKSQLCILNRPEANSSFKLERLSALY
jgi:hypothetical protein